MRMEADSEPFEIESVTALQWKESFRIIPDIMAYVLMQGCQASFLQNTPVSSFMPTVVWLILQYLAVTA
ncbi:uncharacterized [Tachysurus ichikawai]